LAQGNCGTQGLLLKRVKTLKDEPIGFGTESGNALTCRFVMELQQNRCSELVVNAGR
jgi:hypothetical protein